MFIPDNRPVLGSDLVAFRDRYDLTNDDMMWMLGMSPTDWFETTGSARPRMLKDEARAILMRFVDECPELSPLGRRPNAGWLFEKLTEAHGPETTLKRFSLAFGRTSGAAFRWVRHGARPDPAAARLMAIWLAADARGMGSIFPHLEHLADTEAKARGVADLRRGGSWRKPVAAHVLARSPRAPQKRRTHVYSPRRRAVPDQAD